MGCHCEEMDMHSRKFGHFIKTKTNAGLEVSFVEAYHASHVAHLKERDKNDIL